MTSLAIVTALWGRPRLTRLFMRYWARIAAPLPLVRVAVYSAEDPCPAPREALWKIVAAPNQPLSDKFNAGVEYAWRAGASAVMIVGSDDFACEAFVAEVARRIVAGCDYLIPSGIYAYDVARRAAVLYEAEHMGVGRVLSRRLLDRCQGRPYPSGQGYVNGNMDDRMTALQLAAKRASGGFVDPIFNASTLDLRACSAVLLDVKTPASKNGYHQLATRGKAVNAKRLLETHFPTIAEDLLSWTGS